jgi:hypothetical protein
MVDEGAPEHAAQKARADFICMESALFFAVPRFLTVSRIHLT